MGHIAITLLQSKPRAMSTTTRHLVGVAAVLFAAQASAQITFYEGEHFRGRTFATNSTVRNFERSGFNDRASSAVVERGRWEVCEHARFGGRCVTLRRGAYDSLRAMGMSDRISSVRPVEDRRRTTTRLRRSPQPTYEYRRRPDERLREVPVTSVRAVLGPPEQRCWVERQPVSATSAQASTTCRARSSAASSAASSATRSAAAAARRSRPSAASPAVRRSAPTSAGTNM